MRRMISVAVVLPVLAAPVLIAAPAAAESIVNRAKLQRAIGNSLTRQLDVKVTAKCPKEKWVKGKVFYCRVSASDGSKGRVMVTLKSNATKGRLIWQPVA